MSGNNWWKCLCQIPTRIPPTHREEVLGSIIQQTTLIKHWTRKTKTTKQTQTETIKTTYTDQTKNELHHQHSIHGQNNMIKIKNNTRASNLCQDKALLPMQQLHITYFAMPLPRCCVNNWLVNYTSAVLVFQGSSPAYILVHHCPSMVRNSATMVIAITWPKIVRN